MRSLRRWAVYVDLRPRTDSPPYLRDGSVIAVNEATIPQPIGPCSIRQCLDQQHPQGRAEHLAQQVIQGIQRGRLRFPIAFRLSAKLSGDLNGVADRTRTLTEDTGLFLDAQAPTADSIRTWARGLAGVTGQLVTDDWNSISLLEKGPGAFDEASRLLDQIKPTLPVLLANLTGRPDPRRLPRLTRALLVLLPPFTAAIRPSSDSRHGVGYGGFNLIISDQPACTVGFLPPSEWRNPADTARRHARRPVWNLPQVHHSSARRQYPCIERPGKRAPTVRSARATSRWVPLAMRSKT